jgi:hypothetical protein
VLPEGKLRTEGLAASDLDAGEDEMKKWKTWTLLALALAAASPAIAGDPDVYGPDGPIDFAEQFRTIIEADKRCRMHFNIRVDVVMFHKREWHYASDEIKKQIDNEVEEHFAVPANVENFCLQFPIIFKLAGPPPWAKSKWCMPSFEHVCRDAWVKKE